ncbi:MAG: thermonuclease family protein [Chloroflexi bacterium]|nr:thermonuclease family protein [Chloroflexota bacterium]
MTDRNPGSDDDQQIDHEDVEGHVSGPSQRDMDRSWEDYETVENKLRPGIGAAVWKITVVGISIVILLSMTLAIAGPLLDRSREPVQVRPERTTATVLKVIDGRTIVVSSGRGEQTVRMIGVDAPLFGDLFYDLAQQVGHSWIGGQEVLLEADEQEMDSQGRLLRYVYFDDVMINAALILNGLGKVESEQPNIRYDAFLVDMERRARESGTGIWDPAYNDEVQGSSDKTEASSHFKFVARPAAS